MAFWVHALAIWQHHVRLPKGLDSNCHVVLDPNLPHKSMLDFVAFLETW